MDWNAHATPELLIATIVQVEPQVAAAMGTQLTDANMFAAKDACLADSVSATATYGHISLWDVSRVTNMRLLFAGCSGQSFCNPAAASFNEDISGWNTSLVNTMESALTNTNKAFMGLSVTATQMSCADMFYHAAAFNQPLAVRHGTRTKLPACNVCCRPPDHTQQRNPIMLGSRRARPQSRLR